MDNNPVSGFKPGQRFKYPINLSQLFLPDKDWAKALSCFDIAPPAKAGGNSWL